MVRGFNSIIVRLKEKLPRSIDQFMKMFQFNYCTIKRGTKRTITFDRWEFQFNYCTIKRQGAS